MHPFVQHLPGEVSGERRRKEDGKRTGIQELARMLMEPTDTVLDLLFPSRSETSCGSAHSPIHVCLQPRPPAAENQIKTGGEGRKGCTLLSSHPTINSCAARPISEEMEMVGPTTFLARDAAGSGSHFSTANFLVCRVIYPLISTKNLSTRWQAGGSIASIYWVPCPQVRPLPIMFGLYLSRSKAKTKKSCDNPCR